MVAFQWKVRFEKIFAVVVLATLLSGGAVLRAELVYSNAPPSMTGGGLDLGGFVGAESFLLTHAVSIRAAVFYTDEYSPGWDGTLNYFFFDSNGAFPAAAPLPGGQGSNPAYRKTFLTGGPTTWSTVRYEFDLSTPLMLAPGTYWLGIQLDKEFDGIGLTWVRTITPDAQLSAGARRGDFGEWLLQNSQLALALSDTPVVIPEPNASAILALGAAALWRSLKRGVAKRQIAYQSVTR